MRDSTLSGTTMLASLRRTASKGRRLARVADVRQTTSAIVTHVRIAATPGNTALDHLCFFSPAIRPPVSDGFAK